MIGGLVGIFDGGNVKNCNIKGEFSYTSSKTSSFSGGIIGYMISGRVESCNVVGNISSTSSISYVRSNASISSSGGVIGYMDSGGIENSSIVGSISSNSTASGSDFSPYSYSGGIVGFMRDGDLKNCNITSNISSTSSPYKSSSYSYSYSGGIVGSMKSGNLTSCNVNSSISSYSKSSYSGGIVGLIDEKDKVFIEKNYITSTSTVSGKKADFNDENGQNGKSFDSSHFNEKFYRRLNWDFDNIWIWDNNENKPVLRKVDVKREAMDGVMDKSNGKKQNLSEILNKNIWL